jgi:D-alanyl-lipoteichoic acid acyltransferase DltB (MBOAT superfamily)
LWHGASLRFILWGGLHGVALVVHKLLMNAFPRLKPSGSGMHPLNRLVGVVLTFHIVCFGWIFFRAPSMQSAWDMMSRIVQHFHPEVLLHFIDGYTVVAILMIAGYLFHFMPARLERFMRSLVVRSPLLVQALLLAAAIFAVIQMKSSAVQPFIYFQF